MAKKLLSLFVFKLLAIIATSCRGQTLEYLTEPVLKWEFRLGSGLDAGNAVTAADDGSAVYVTGRDGVFAALDPASGTRYWSYAASAVLSGDISCESGIVMAKGYIVYVVREDNEWSRVIALNPSDRSAKWISDPIEGLNSGNPVVSGDNEWLFLTLNSEFNSIGHFAIVLVSDGSVFFTTSYDEAPFAPPSIYVNPVFGGFYQDGQTNKNDIVIFGCAPVDDDVIPLSGCIFSFQFPENFDGISLFGLNIVKLNSVLWVTKKSPAIGLGGRSLYFGVSRNQFRAWYGDDPNNRALRFDRAARYSFTSLGRGRPAQIPPYTSPSFNSDESRIYWGTADGFVIGVDEALDEVLRISLNVPAVADIVVSNDDSTLFFAERAGLVYAANANFGTTLWSEQMSSRVTAQMSLDSTGSILYVGDEDGTIKAWVVATGTTTVQPSDAPSGSPSDAPSGSPSVNTSQPSDIPTGSPSVSPLPDYCDLLPEMQVENTVRKWLDDDMASFDVGGLVVGSKQVNAHLWMNSPGVFAGKPFFQKVFDLVGCTIDWQVDAVEGNEYDVASDEERQLLAIVQGPANALLRGQRISLSCLSRCSGVATASKEAVEHVRALNWTGQVAGTSKTTPGFQIVEKYGVLVGGAATYRLDPSQTVMLNDNHIWSVGGFIKDALERARKVAGFGLKIEVQCKSLDEAMGATAAGADIVMLHNFEPDQLKTVAQTIKQIYPNVTVGASGGITTETIGDYLSEHIDVISQGNLTESYHCLDFSLEIQK